ncbi:hypothetical protein [uncultured Helicobacter sp.]|uniref:SGNH/GDSL hydrolase family protein n=1 Tax=uncultured Helicobacter sp. TaxID=175537 RepID=UPI0026038C97|nr:hypothetical protein [uncultured Helicobacter sp.]
MKEKTKVVLLGGSNSIAVNGLQKGLRQENIELTNLALGGTDNLQNLFELVHSKNQKVLSEADFIVIETNINDSHMIPQGFNLQTIGRNFCWLCEKLYQFNKKVIFLILPFVYDNLSLNALLKSKANYYGFNVVDIHEQYKKWGLLQFYNTTDAYHQIYALMNLNRQSLVWVVRRTCQILRFSLLLNVWVQNPLHSYIMVILPTKKQLIK